MKTILITVVLATCAVVEGMAMPTKEEAERAEPVVRKLMAPERAALESGKKTRTEVAASAMKLAEEADTEAAKLLLMKGAFVLYVKDGNLEKAVETMNALEKAITDLPPQSVTNMIELALLGVSKKEDGARLYRLLDEAKENLATANRGLQNLSSGAARRRTYVGEASPPPHDGKGLQKQMVVDGYSWSYRESNGEATIVANTGVRYSCAISPKPKGHVSIPATLGGARVTSIGRDAFWELGGLTSVSIPSSVTNIGYCAFHGCGGLTSVTIPPSAVSIERGAFYGCEGLKSVTMSEGVTRIGSDAFACCNGLTSVTIPESVKTIEDGVFRKCGELISVTMLGERPNAHANAFRDNGKLVVIHVPANAKSWAGMKEWQGIPLVFDAKPQVAKDRTTVQSIIDGMIKVPGRDYWLSETELTQGQWEAVMGYNLSTRKGANLPVENVSRDECAVFLEKLNETKEVLLTRFEFGLPTLNEWSYAAQAGGCELDCWIKPGVVGDVFDMAWVAENSSNQTHVVATKAANAFGFYDNWVAE